MNDNKMPFSTYDWQVDTDSFSQRRLSILLIVGIFIAEIIAMVVIYYIRPEPYWLETLVDASIMITLIFPLLYYFHFRPLFTQIKERNRSEGLLGRVLENLPVGVWITDHNGNIIHGNQASHKIWSGARYVGIEKYGEYKAWRVDTGKRVEPAEWAAARTLQHGETILDEELEIECFDGSHKVILNSSTPFYENNSLQGVIVINQDITERKRAEQAVIKSETMFKTAFRALPVGAWITDEYGKIIYGNPAGQQIWAGAKYVGIEQFGEYKAWWLSTGERIQPEDWAIARAILTGETSLNEEIEIECFDGTHKLILNSAIPVCDDLGRFHGVFVINEDVTERKRAEQALIQSNELIGRAFNSIDVLIAYMDRGFNFIMVNDAYASADGQPARYYEGKNHFDIFPNAENQAIFQQVVDSGEPYSVLKKPFEYPSNPERGVTYWNWRLQPVHGADGLVQGVVLSLVDVTERERAELLLQQQNQDLITLSAAESRQRALAEGLVESTLAVNASLELQEVLKTILEQIHRSIDYRLANIALIDAGDLKVVYQIDRSMQPNLSKTPVNQYRLEDFPLIELMRSTHQPALIDDTNICPEAQLIPDLEWPCSYLAAPLIVGERLIGVINLASDQIGAFQPEIARRLMAFAAPAALAVENARLYAAEYNARQVAEILNEVSRALTQTLNFEKVINTLLEYVCRLVPSDRAYIVVAENESKLRLQAMCGFEDDPDPTHTLNASFEEWDTTYLHEVIITRQNLLISDTLHYPGWTTIISGETIRNWLGIPILVNEKAIGVLALAKTSPAFFNAEHVKLAEVVIAQASMAVQNAWLFEQVRAGHERLQSLSRRLVEVQESERRYIARELHDEASQSLTALKLGLRLLEQEVDQPHAFTARMAELKLLTEKVLEELHCLAMDLRPASLDYMGLVVTLEQLIKILGERYHLNMRLKVNGFGENLRLPNYVETNVYRIVQEALTNAVRHANASNIDVILEYRDGDVMVIIEDDGIGFETSQMRKSGHLGLLGMQERAQMMAGTLQVESTPGSGTTIVVEIPYVNPHFDR